MPLNTNPSEQIAAARFLIENGAHLIRCGTRVSEKAPISQGWQKQPDTIDQITDHLAAGKRCGIIPASIGAVAVDVDATTPDAAGELRDKIKAILGDEGFICDSPSLSHYTEGSRRGHSLWQSTDKPLGTSNGKPIVKRNNLRLDGNPVFRFDLLHAGCQIVVPDLARLASGYRQRKDGACDKWDELYKRGRKQDKQSSIQPPLQIGPDQGRIRTIVDNYLARMDPIADGDNNNTANRILYWAGQISNWAPCAHDAALQHLKSQGCKQEDIDHCEKYGSFKRGAASPQSIDQCLKPEVIDWINGKRSKSSPMPPIDDAPLPEPPSEHKSSRNPTMRFPNTYLESLSTNDRIREACSEFRLKFRRDTILESMQFKENGGQWKPLEDGDLADIQVGMEDACLVKEIKDGKPSDPIKWIAFRPGSTPLKRNLHALATRNPYDAVEDFISRIKDYNPAWGNPLEELREEFGIEDSELNRWCMFIMFAPAYYFNSRERPRPVRPTVILAGEQETGKSAHIKEAIFPDLQPRLHSAAYLPDASAQKRTEAVVGKLLAELPEMQRWSGRQLDQHKAFSQLTIDTGVRLSYRRNVGDYKRTCWMIGTANRPDCLPDDDTIGQANTRFVVLECTKGLDIEKWYDCKRDDMPGSPTNRDRLWAFVKFETERTLRVSGSLRMPSSIRGDHAKNIDKHQSIQEAMHSAILGLTWEIENAEADKSDGYDSPADDQFFRKHFGYSLGEIMQRATFRHRYMGGRTDLSRMGSRAVETRLGIAMTRMQPSLWSSRRLRVGKETPRTRYFRTAEPLPAHAFVHACKDDGSEYKVEEARRMEALAAGNNEDTSRPERAVQ